MRDPGTNFGAGLLHNQPQGDGRRLVLDPSRVDLLPRARRKKARRKVYLLRHLESTLSGPPSVAYREEHKRLCVWLWRHGVLVVVGRDGQIVPGTGAEET